MLPDTGAPQPNVLAEFLRLLAARGQQQQQPMMPGAAEQPGVGIGGAAGAGSDPFLESSPFLQAGTGWGTVTPPQQDTVGSGDRTQTHTPRPTPAHPHGTTAPIGGSPQVRALFEQILRRGQGHRPQLAGR